MTENVDISFVWIAVRWKLSTTIDRRMLAAVRRRWMIRPPGVRASFKLRRSNWGRAAASLGLRTPFEPMS